MFLCMKFAEFIDFIARDGIMIIVLFRFWNKILDEPVLDIFWFMYKKRIQDRREYYFYYLNQLCLEKQKNHHLVKLDGIVDKTGL